MGMVSSPKSLSKGPIAVVCANILSTREGLVGRSKTEKWCCVMPSIFLLEAEELFLNFSVTLILPRGVNLVGMSDAEDQM